MKKIIKSIIIVFLLMNLGLTIQMGVASAQDVSKNPLTQIQSIGEGTGLPAFTSSGQHPDAPPDALKPGLGTVTSPIMFALDLFRFAISGIAMIMVIIATIKLVSTASDEEATKAKTTLLIGIIGLLVIQLADVAVKKIFFGEQGEAFQDVVTVQDFAKEGTTQIRYIIGFVEVFVAATAVFVIVLRGFLLVTSAGEEEDMTKTKKHILYSAAGLVAVMLSEVIVRGFIFPEDGKEIPYSQGGIYIIKQIVNYLAGFVSILAFAGLFYGGYRYVVSGGNEEMTEKIKKIIIGAVIALVLSMSAYAIVNTLLDLKPEYMEQNAGEVQK